MKKTKQERRLKKPGKKLLTFYLPDKEIEIINNENNRFKKENDRMRKRRKIKIRILNMN